MWHIIIYKAAKLTHSSNECRGSDRLMISTKMLYSELGVPQTDDYYLIILVDVVQVKQTNLKIPPDACPLGSNPVLLHCLATPPQVAF